MPITAGDCASSACRLPWRISTKWGLELLELFKRPIFRSVAKFCFASKGANADAIGILNHETLANPANMRHEIGVANPAKKA